MQYKKEKIMTLNIRNGGGVHLLIASKIRFTPFMFEDFVEPVGVKSLLGARFE